MNAAAKRHRLTCMRRREYFRRLGKAASGLPLRQCGRWSQRAHEHTSTRAHDIQPIPPQKNLTIRGSTSPAAAQKYVTNTHQDAPPYRAAPRLKHRQWARSSRQHTLRPDVPDTPPHRKRLTPRHHAQTVVHYTPNTPCHPHSTEVDCTLSKHAGDFATIDPRHADDTPQRSAYGSNSPHRAQASTKPAPEHPQASSARVGT